MLPKILVVVVLGAAFGAVLLNGTLSLAGDVGVSDADACATVARYGPAAVQRLESSGFPHASAGDVERYRLTRGGQVEAMLEIDWQRDTARCLPLDASIPYTASFDANERAYAAIVRELSSVMATGSMSGDKLESATNIWLGTDINGPLGEPLSGYKSRLVGWSLGRFFQEVAN